MLSKRKNPLSDVFDPYLEDDGAENLWPEEGPLPPPVEPSGYRPAPTGPGEPPVSDVTELVASKASLPTPRQVQWALDEPDEESPLPIVTAVSEPTQRGLGIPPPPSSREAPWFAELPSLASAPAPSPESFTDAGANETPVRAPSAEPSENERTTVRAPPNRRSSGHSNRRRAVAVGLLAAMVVVTGLVVRRATTRSEDPVSTAPAAARESPAPANSARTPIAFEDNRAPLEPSAIAGNAPARDLTNDKAEAAPDGDRKREARRRRAERESRREKARHKARDLAKARPSGSANFPDVSGSGSNLGAPPAETKPPERREALSLPPR
jgi:hypothetical protein